jgi:RNA polymerase sigma factor (sigma-70 family)
LAAVPSIGRASLVEAPGRAPQAAATEGLFERHSAKILSYCLHQLGSREEAEDAVQTTFMNAFRALGRGVVPEAESAWLFKIAENVCLSRRRSSWRRGRIESPSDFEIIEEIIPGPSRQRDELIGIEDALAGMPEQQRRAILLREWQGLSYREIAHELELSQSAVETLIFRARRSLAHGLEQPDAVKPKRKSFRRALHALDLGTVVAALKTVLAGSAAVKATAAAVAVTAAVGTAASVAPTIEGTSRTQAPAPASALVVSAPAAVSEDAAAPTPVGRDRVAAVGAPVRKPQKPAEKATAKPPLRTKPVHVVAAAPTSAVPAEHPATAPVEHPNAGEPQKGNKHEAEPAPVAAAPAESPKPEKGNGHAKPAEPPAEAAAPAAVTAPSTAVAPQVAGAKNESKKDKPRVNGGDKRELTVAPANEPAPVLDVSAPAVASEPAGADVVAPAPEAAPADLGKVNGKSEAAKVK